VDINQSQPTSPKKGILFSPIFATLGRDTNSQIIAFLDIGGGSGVKIPKKVTLTAYTSSGYGCNRLGSNRSDPAFSSVVQS